jgi:hypothetical protein
MQIGKAGVVAAGALATLAVIGSAASAAPTAGSAHVDPVKTAASTLKQAALQRAMGAAGTAVSSVARGPRQDVRQPLISIGNSTALNALALQSCGSTTGNVGTATVVNTANTVLGDCANSNILVRQAKVQGLISIMDNTAVNVAPIQACGSNLAVGGATVATSSPATVIGDCYNANAFIAAPKEDDKDAPISLMSVGSGSVVNAGAIQVCGSTASIGGAATGLQSPTTVLGDCYNSNSTIQKRKSPALIPLLSNQVVDLMPLQVCATSGFVGQAGPALPINSPAFVAGECVTGQQKYLD